MTDNNLNEEFNDLKKPKKKGFRLLIPIMVILFIAAAGAAVFLGRSEQGRIIIEKVKTQAIGLIKKLPFEKIPFLSKFIKKEEAEPIYQEIPEEVILVKVYKVARRDFQDSMPSLGTVKGYREMNLKFEINGVIDSINFREGEEIREGDIIASLDQYDALLKLKYAQIELAKTKKLFEIGSIIKSKVEQTELEYESAKSDLDKTYLYAPRDGVLATRDAEIGEFITNNEKIVTLIDDTDVFVEIGVIERDVGKVTVGLSAKAYVDAYPDTVFKGRIDNVAPVIEGRSRTQTVKIRINNAKRLLLPGMFARVLIDVYTKENAIVIPNAGLNKEEQGYIVYIINKTEPEELGTEGLEEGDEDEEMEVLVLMEEEIGESGIVEARPILFEYRSSDFSVIKEGLEEGDLVVVETQEKLRDEMKVMITEVQEQFL